MDSRFLLLSVVVVVVVVSALYFVISPYIGEMTDTGSGLITSSEVPVRAAVGDNETASTTVNAVTQATTTKLASEEEGYVPPITPKKITQDQIPPAETGTPTHAQADPDYSYADVVLHDGKKTCWTVIGGKVYDVTSYVFEHPGGYKHILEICGKDGTKAFADQHGGESKPANVLQQFYIGKLTN